VPSFLSSALMVSDRIRTMIAVATATRILSPCCSQNPAGIVLALYR